MSTILLLASLFCTYAWFFPPYSRERGLDLLLEAGDQFAVGGDQRLLGFDLGTAWLFGRLIVVERPRASNLLVERNIAFELHNRICDVPRLHKVLIAPLSPRQG